MTEAPKRYRIKNMRVDRASIVPKGANQGAHILLWKSDEGAAKPILVRAREALAKMFGYGAPELEVAATTAQVAARNEFFEDWCEAREAFEQAASSIIKAGGPAMLPMLRTSCEEFLMMVEAAANGDKNIPLEMMDAALSSMAADTSGIAKSADLTLEDVKKTLDLIETQANFTGRSAAPEGAETMSILKSAVTLSTIIAALPESDRATVEKEIADKVALAKSTPDAGEVQKLAKQLEEEKASRANLEKQFADAQDRTLTKELAVEVGGLHIPGLTVDEAVTLLKGKDAVLVRKMFAAATVEKKATAKLLKEVGHSEDVDPESAIGTVEKLAKEKMAKDPKLTIHTATALVYKETPDLYTAVNAEAQAARGVSHAGLA